MFTSTFNTFCCDIHYLSVNYDRTSHLYMHMLGEIPVIIYGLSPNILSFVWFFNHIILCKFFLVLFGSLIILFYASFF